MKKVKKSAFILHFSKFLLPFLYSYFFRACSLKNGVADDKTKKSSPGSNSCNPYEE